MFLQRIPRANDSVLLATPRTLSTALFHVVAPVVEKVHYWECMVALWAWVPTLGDLFEGEQVTGRSEVTKADCHIQSICIPRPVGLKAINRSHTVL